MVYSVVAEQLLSRTLPATRSRRLGTFADTCGASHSHFCTHGLPLGALGLPVPSSRRAQVAFRGRAHYPVEVRLTARGIFGGWVTARLRYPPHQGCRALRRHPCCRFGLWRRLSSHDEKDAGPWCPCRPLTPRWAGKPSVARRQTRQRVFVASEKVETFPPLPNSSDTRLPAQLRCWFRCRRLLAHSVPLSLRHKNPNEINT